MLAHIDYMEETIAALSQELDTILEPFRRSIELLQTIPGFSNVPQK